MQKLFCRCTARDVGRQQSDAGDLSAVRPAFQSAGHDQLEIDVCIRAEGRGFSPYRDVTPRTHTVRGAQSLPGMAIDREAMTLPLTDDITAQPLPGIVVVAVRTGQVELTTALHIEGPASFKERLRRSVDADMHG